MKPLNETELLSLVTWMNSQIKGARVQEIWTAGETLWLEVYLRGTFQIQIDLKANQCFVLLRDERHLTKKIKKPKPISLFLQSHARNQLLEEIRVIPELGRALEILFSNGCRLQITLIPQGPNASVFFEGKSLHWEKPKEWPTRDRSEVKTDFPVRWKNADDYLADYLSWKAGSSVRGVRKEDVPTHPQASGGLELDPRLAGWRRELEKKNKALHHLEKELTEERSQDWLAFGEELKMGQPLPQHPLWSAKLSLAQNREQAFAKGKEIRGKRKGIEERIAILQQEIELRRQWLAAPEQVPTAVAPPSRGHAALVKSESRGKTLTLPSGLQAILGRSAKDNLAILRQARAWDYWLHLKDEPSAHVIVFREKNQNIRNEDIEAVAEWLLKNLGKKMILAGSRYDVICVECRFVRPIKGDKLGRVTYHSPIVYSFASKSDS